MSLLKFKFKKEPVVKGFAGVSLSSPSVSINLGDSKIGKISFNDGYISKETDPLVVVRFKFDKEKTGKRGTDQDSNPNCIWEWVTIKYIWNWGINRSDWFGSKDNYKEVIRLVEGWCETNRSYLEQRVYMESK